jgi:hypothetical protein
MSRRQGQAPPPTRELRFLEFGGNRRDMRAGRLRGRCFQEAFIRAEQSQPLKHGEMRAQAGRARGDSNAYSKEIDYAYSANASWDAIWAAIRDALRGDASCGRKLPFAPGASRAGGGGLRGDRRGKPGQFDRRRVWLDGGRARCGGGGVPQEMGHKLFRVDGGGRLLVFLGRPMRWRTLHGGFAEPDAR